MRLTEKEQYLFSLSNLLWSLILMMNPPFVLPLLVMMGNKEIPSLKLSSSPSKCHYITVISLFHRHRSFLELSQFIISFENFAMRMLGHDYYYSMIKMYERTNFKHVGTYKRLKLMAKFSVWYENYSHCRLKLGCNIPSRKWCTVLLSISEPHSNDWSYIPSYEMLVKNC